MKREPLKMREAALLFRRESDGSVRLLAAHVGRGCLTKVKKKLATAGPDADWEYCSSGKDPLDGLYDVFKSTHETGRGWPWQTAKALVDQARKVLVRNHPR